MLSAAGRPGTRQHTATQRRGCAGVVHMATGVSAGAALPWVPAAGIPLFVHSLPLVTGVLGYSSGHRLSLAYRKTAQMM